MVCQKEARDALLGRVCDGVRVVDGDTLVCTPGGNVATLVALHKKTGQLIWKCALPEGDEAAYASAILVEAGGVKQYVQLGEIKSPPDFDSVE